MRRMIEVWYAIGRFGQWVEDAGLALAKVGERIEDRAYRRRLKAERGQWKGRLG